MTAPPRLVYMGTPDFAVPCLTTLHEAGYNIQAVVTQPDRPSGRGRKTTAPPVKRAALALGYPVEQPVSVRDERFIAAMRRLAPDFLVVVAFGQILPEALLVIPSRGPINVHASLLPRYRGPAPIQWVILRGEEQTGVTTMLMDRGVDSGDILLSTATPIAPHDTAATLHERLAGMGAVLLVQTIEALWRGELFPQAQNGSAATYAPLLCKTDGRIDWRQPAIQIERRVRAMDPWPGTYCYWENQRLQVFRVRVIDASHQAEPGTVLPGFPDELRVAAGAKQIGLLEVQGPSGKRLEIGAFLHGHPIVPGTVLG